MESGTASSSAAWRPVHHWPAAARPAALWPLITETASLTERLRQRAGDTFSVRLLSHSHAVLSAEDAVLLGSKPDAAGYVRRVFLYGRGRPWVYARSLAAGRAESWLKNLGAQPLGERVFLHADARRSPVEAAHLDLHHHLCKEALAHLDESERATLAKPLWARRSLITVEGAGILIYECFLPALENG